MGRYDEAERELLQATRIPDTDKTRRRRKTMERLAALYEVWGKADQAATWSAFGVSIAEPSSKQGSASGGCETWFWGWGQGRLVRPWPLAGKLPVPPSRCADHCPGVTGVCETLRSALSLRKNPLTGMIS